MSAETDSQVQGGTGRPGFPWRRWVLVGLLLPLVAAVVLVWSTTGREQNLDKVPVAIVNNDQIIQSPQPMAAGRALAGALTEPSSDQTNLDWTLADTKDAQAGLENGDYYAVLTIPQDFSKAILSSGTDKPFQGELTLVSNGAASTTVPYISQTIASAAATSLGNQTTQGYLGQVYDGFNQIASSNQKAASSAGQVADGTSQVSAGAKNLESGTDDLASGLGQLASGAGELEGGTGSVASGAGRLAGGAQGLAQGARKLHTGADQLAGSARKLAGKDSMFARQARTLARGAVKTSVGAHALALRTRATARRLAALEGLCTDRGVLPRLCAALGRASDQASALADASGKVAQGTGQVARGNVRLAGGAAGLADGSRRLAGGAESLARASGQVSSGADDLAGGAASLARGAQETDQAAGQVASGAASSADAGSQLASGSSSLVSGAASTDSGAQQLSQGLAKGAKESPTYDKDQKKALEKAVSVPVVMTSSVDNTDHGNGWLVGLVLGVVLWLAALLGVLIRDVTRALRDAGAPLSSGRLTSVQLRPAAGLAALQGAAVLVALPLLQVSTAKPLQLALLTLLAAVTFTLLGVALRWALGGAGVVAFVLLLLLQAAALGNVVPIETAPELLQTLNSVMPLTAYVNGMSQLVTGGSVGSLAGVVTVLLGWSAASWLVAVMVVRRRRVARVRGVLVPA
jgi:putative membrane protein